MAIQSFPWHTGGYRTLQYLGQLIQIVFQEGNLLLLRETPARILALLPRGGLLHPGLQVLDEELPQVVQRLQLLRHRLLQALQVLARLLAALVERDELLEAARLLLLLLLELLVVALELVVGEAEGLVVVPHLVQEGLLLRDLVAEGRHLLLVLLAMLVK